MKKQSGKHFFTGLAVAIGISTAMLSPLSVWAGETVIAFEPPANSNFNNLGWIDLSSQVQQNITDQKYAEALGIFVWYYNNGLKYHPAEYGVRNSFCLAEWIEFGEVYPPALAELQKIRDAKEKLFLDNKIAMSYPGANADGTPRDWQQNPPKSEEESMLQLDQAKGDTPIFHDIEAINGCLNTPQKTIVLFLQIEQNNPAMAQKIWRFAEDTVLEQKDYATAAHYIPDVKAEWKRRADMFQNDMQRKMSKEQYKHFKEAMIRILTDRANQLSALARYQNHPQDAEEIQNELKELIK